MLSSRVNRKKILSVAARIKYFKRLASCRYSVNIPVCIWFLSQRQLGYPLWNLPLRGHADGWEVWRAGGRGRRTEMQSDLPDRAPEGS